MIVQITIQSAVEPRDNRVVIVGYEELPLSIGRGNADIFLYDPKCSREHALVSLLPNQGLLLEDRGSKNGTRIDGVRVIQQQIQPQSRIQIGDTTLEIKLVQVTTVITLERENSAITDPENSIDNLFGGHWLDLDHFDRDAD